MNLLRRLLSALVYAEHYTIPVPADMDVESVNRLYRLGFTAEDAVWLTDWFRTCEFTLRQNDGAAVR